ncbi:hypothetical protein TWF506_003975 [Arthrobotrys conoides]|uniref:Uncharacterized protein n=1 Tax=Arthrobotrys conoides TaxID=74498 RepID=A0AAN8NAQ9_9PEZI
MKFSDFLEAIAPPVQSTPKLTLLTQTTVPRYSHRPEGSLVEWTDVRSEIENLLAPLLPQEFPRLGEISQGLLEILEEVKDDACDEKQVSENAALAYEMPVRILLKYLFNIKSAWSDHRSARCIGDPDRLFIVGDRADITNTPRLVVKYETPWDLDTPDDLARFFNETISTIGYEETRGNKLVGAVAWLYGYMTFNNLKFGILSTYEKVFLFQREENEGLKVSSAFKFSDKGIESPVAALVFICHRVSQAGYFYSSPTEEGSRGSPILYFEEGLDFDGFSGEGSGWKDIQLHLGERASKKYATLVKGEIKAQDKRNTHPKRQLSVSSIPVHHTDLRKIYLRTPSLDDNNSQVPRTTGSAGKIYSNPLHCWNSTQLVAIFGSRRLWPELRRNPTDLASVLVGGYRGS